MPDDKKEEKTGAPAANVGASATAAKAEPQFKPVPDDESELPAKPWSVNPNCKNNLIDRYGPIGGLEMYRRVALKYGHFDPRNEAAGYRPDLQEGDAPGEITAGK